MEEAELVAQARVIYRAYQDDHLAKTALAGLDEWIGSGGPPPRSEIDTRETSPHETSMARRAFIRRWGFSIPCSEAVAALSELGPLVELGAGTAYWTALLRNAGVDIVATNPKASSMDYGFDVGRYAECEPLAAAEAVLAHPRRSVFCSWPSEGEPWLTEALRLLRQGAYAALILDERPCMTGDDLLPRLLKDAFEHVSTVEIPRFPRVQDILKIYRRR